MRLLIYEWESYLQYDVKYLCSEKHIQTETFSWKFADKNHDEAFESWFEKNVDCSRFDALLSVNFWPMLSKVAQKKGLKYLAWCYDNPLNVIEPELTLGNPVNYVFFFDRVQAEGYIQAGFDTVYYLPLGVNSTRLRSLQVGKSDYQKYSADVSLVGSLYESRLQEIKALMDEHTKGYVDATMVAQQNLYGCYLFDKVITDELVEKMNAYVKEAMEKYTFLLVIHTFQ